MSSTAIGDAPKVGDLVDVRGRKWVVGEVEPAPTERSTLVTLQSVEDGEYGRSLDVIWEGEPGRRVRQFAALPEKCRASSCTGRLPRASGSGAETNAKVAIADLRALLVSSVNPTRSGVKSNMEAGVLVRGGAAVLRAAQHVEQLIAWGVLVRLHSGEAG